MRRLQRSGYIVSIMFALCFSTQAFAAEVECAVVAAPAKTLATQSKYDQSDSSRSTILDRAHQERNAALTPIRRSIAELAQISFATQDALKTSPYGACINENVIRWARAGALTQMDTADAYLARDRFMGEILLTMMSSAKKYPMTSEDRVIVNNWLVTIADQTVEFYEYRAGQKSKMNNHRYWAGLSVGATGFFLGNKKYEDWGKLSYELGVCQVDAAGFLPLELSRGELALDYHIYSLRPLQALAKLAAEKGSDLEGECNAGLKRLRDQTLAAIKDSNAIRERTGEDQIVRVKESSFVAPLQFAALGLLQSP
jgi:Alginate lyase